MKISLTELEIDGKIECDKCEKYIGFVSEYPAEGTKFWCLDCASEVKK